MIGSSDNLHSSANGLKQLPYTGRPIASVEYYCPLSGGETRTEQRTDITVEEDGTSMIAMPSTTTVRDLVRVMNSIGATPRDIIEILQAIDRAGALHGELVNM